MSESLQPGLHPNPDSLSAFIEGVLPEHERVACVAHLAECAECREVVYLAQEPLAPESAPAPVSVEPEKISFSKRWLRPVPVLTFATALGTFLLSFSLYEHLRSIPQAPAVVAIATPPVGPVPPSVSAPASAGEAEIQPWVLRPAPAVAPKNMVPTPKAKSATPTELPAAEPPLTPPPPPAKAAVMAAPAALAPAPLAAPSEAVATFSSVPKPTGIAGTITDPAGAAISGAAVKLRPVASAASKDVTSDPKGQFNVAGLEPGPYEVQVSAQGFNRLTKQIEVPPNEIARADSTLQVGSISETISVTAESSQVQTTTSNRAGLAGGGGGGGRGGRGGGSAGALPASGRSTRALNQVPGLSLDASIDSLSLNKTPPATTITKGKVMLRIDSAGPLLLSDNAGKKWKMVKAVWSGKVTGLILLTSSASSDPSFQLTTDGGAIWLSRDGSHWYAAPK